MCVTDALGFKLQDCIPICRQCLIVIVTREIFKRFEIADDTSAVVQDHGNAVFAVTRSADDLTVDPYILQEFATLFSRDNNG